jgi:hypothetical protein
LLAITEPGVDVSEFYPRCYDLSDHRQLDLWTRDFDETAIMNSIKKHAVYFQTLLNLQTAETQLQFASLLKKQPEKVMFAELKRIQKDLQHKQFEVVTQETFGFVNVNLLQQALYFCQN